LLGGLGIVARRFGQEEANHGTARYPVDNDGLIEVPLEAVGPHDDNRRVRNG
jgi:hypothetical protein